MKTLLITFDSVSKSYDTRTRAALDSISFEADRGEFVFLVGASGSGKSTVIRLILREEVPTKGRISVAGKSVVKMPSWRVPYLRRGIGTVFRDKKIKALVAKKSDYLPRWNIHRPTFPQHDGGE